MANLQKIKEIAIEKNIAMKTIAEAVDLTPQALSRIMRLGSTNTDTLERIADVLGVSAAVFFAPTEPVSHVSQQVALNLGQMAGRDITNTTGASDATQQQLIGEISAQRKLAENAQKLTEEVLAVLKKMQGL